MDLRERLCSVAPREISLVRISKFQYSYHISRGRRALGAPRRRSSSLPPARSTGFGARSTRRALLSMSSSRAGATRMPPNACCASF